MPIYPEDLDQDDVVAWEEEEEAAWTGSGSANQTVFQVCIKDTVTDTNPAEWRKKIKKYFFL